MNHSKADIHHGYHHKHSVSCPRQYEDEICDSSEGFIITPEINRLMVLEGEMISKPNNDFLLNGGEGNRIDLTNHDSVLLQEKRSMHQGDDLDPPRIRSLNGIEEIDNTKLLSCNHDYSSKFASAVPILDSYTTATATATSPSTTSPSSDSQTIHNRFDQFLLKHQKENKRAEKPHQQEEQQEQQEESQIQQNTTTAVQHHLDKFDLELGRSDSSSSNDKGGNEEEPNHEPKESRVLSLEYHDDSFSHFLDQKMPARWIEEGVYGCNAAAGITPPPTTSPTTMTGGGETAFPATESPSYACTDPTSPPQPRLMMMMAELRDHPHRVSFQGPPISFPDLEDGSDESAQEQSIVSLEPTTNHHHHHGTTKDSDQALHMINDDCEEIDLDTDDLDDDDDALINSICLMQPLPFVPPRTLEGKQEMILQEESTSKESQEPSHFDAKASAAAMDITIFPFGNLFAIEELQQDLLACNLPQKRLFETTKDEDHHGGDLLSHPPLKRFKSCPDGDERELLSRRDSILTLDQIVLAANDEPSTTVVATKPAAVKPPKRSNKKQDIARSIEFTKMYQQCQSFSEAHGHCAIPVKFPANPDLAVWAKKVRNARSRIISRGGNLSSRVLSEEQMLELDKIGFCWNLKEHDWNTTFESLQDQVRKYGVAGGSHTRWLKSQRKKLSKDKLNPDQAQKISSLNFRPTNGFPTTACASV